MESVGDKINYPWEDITDPLYLPPKAWRTGLLASWKGYGPHGINLCKSVESVGD